MHLLLHSRCCCGKTNHADNRGISATGVEAGYEPPPPCSCSAAPRAFGSPSRRRCSASAVAKVVARRAQRGTTRTARGAIEDHTVAGARAAAQARRRTCCISKRKQNQTSVYDSPTTTCARSAARAVRGSGTRAGGTDGARGAQPGPVRGHATTYTWSSAPRDRCRAMAVLTTATRMQAVGPSHRRSVSDAASQSRTSIPRSTAVGAMARCVRAAATSCTSKCAHPEARVQAQN